MNLDILVKCISMVCEVFKAYLAYLNFKKRKSPPPSFQLQAVISNNHILGADRLLVCSFYLYYTPERRICQGLFLPENAVIFMPWDSAETKLRTFVLFYNAVCTMPQCPYRPPKTAPPPFLPHTINQQKEECICL